MKEMMYFKCRGFGHLQCECHPNKLLVTLEDHQVLLASLEHDKEVDSPKSMVMETFWQSTPMFELEQEHHNLIICKTLMATPKTSHKQEQKGKFVSNTLPCQ